MSEQQLEQLYGEAQSLLAKGAHTEAYKILKKLDQRVPNHPGILYLIGVCQSIVGNKTNAVQTYKRVINLHPNFIEAYNNMGLDLIKLGQSKLAIEQFDIALKISPDFTEATLNKAAALISLRNIQAAIDLLDALYQRLPNDPLVLSNLGKAFCLAQKHQQALNFFDAALQVAPNNQDILEGKLLALMALQQWADLLTTAKQALSINVDHKPSQHAKIAARLHLNDWSAEEPTDDEAFELNPLIYLYLCRSLKQQEKNARAYTNKLAVGTNNPLPPVEQVPKIRVGYFSCDFREHPIAYLTAGLYEAHDRDKFEIYCYATEGGPPPSSPIRQRIKDGCDHFLTVGELPDAAIVHLARSHHLDIAIDLTGYTDGARPQIFAERVAPVQISYLGFPGSSGAGYIDYTIGDSVITPMQLRDSYSERIIIMPDCFQSNDQARRIAPPQEPTTYGLPPSAFVLACFNQHAKISPTFFSCWMRLLKAIPNAILWLAPAPQEQIANLNNEAAHRGVEPARLIFGSRLPYDEHLARYALADIVLDTFPFNGGTTTSDALWGGAPVVTCTGETYASRMSASLLSAINLPELITDSLEAYEALVLQLASDRSALAEIRNKLAANRLSCPIFDTAKFTQHLEEAFRMAVARQRAGLTPQHLEVPAQTT